MLVRPRGQVDAVECKWDPAEFDSASLAIFRAQYPRGRNYLVTPHGGPDYARRFGNLEVTVCSPEGIGAHPSA